MKCRRHRRHFFVIEIHEWNMTPIIRQLKTSDAAALREIRLEALSLYPHHYTATYESEAGHDVEWFKALLAWEEVFAAYDATGNICATACLTPDLRPRNEHKALLRMVYVQPDKQGQGLAKSVLSATLDYAKGRYEQILLSVESSNSGAIRLYESFGFTVYGNEPHATKLLDGGYLDDVWMILFL